MRGESERKRGSAQLRWSGYGGHLRMCSCVTQDTATCLPFLAAQKTSRFVRNSIRANFRTRFLGRGLEAATGVEPVIKVLQTSALPLGHAAEATGHYRHPSGIFQFERGTNGHRLGLRCKARLFNDLRERRILTHDATRRQARRACCIRRRFKA